MLNNKAHIGAIDSAIQELVRLHPRTASPAPLPHQYIGTVVDNTAALLTAPANFLDGGGRGGRFTETNNWLSLMQAVHRSFLASIHLATERGLVAFCEESGIVPSCSLYETSSRAIAKIEAEVGENDTVRRALKELKAQIPNRPFFDDYLNAALSASQLDKKTKTQWRHFFRALSIVRNKGSHSDPALTESERQKLADGGFGVLVSPTGELVINPRMYVQIASHLLDFFDLLSLPFKPLTAAVDKTPRE